MNAQRLQAPLQTNYPSPPKKLKTKAKPDPVPQRVSVTTVIACVVTIAFAIAFTSKQIEIIRLNNQINKLKQENYTLAQRIDELSNELLQANSPYVIEQKARLELGMVFPGEQRVIWKVIPAAEQTAKASFWDDWLERLMQPFHALLERARDFKLAG